MKDLFISRLLRILFHSTSAASHSADAMASLPATQQGDIKKLFSQIETRAKRKKLQESARRYVALKKAVAERLEGSSMCLPPEILGSVVRFVSVKCFTRASVASSEWCEAFKLQSAEFWKTNALKRFPIIAVFPGSVNTPDFYKEQYRKQLGVRRRFAAPASESMNPTSSLDDYTFSVELLTGSAGEDERSRWVGTAMMGSNVSSSSSDAWFKTGTLPASLVKEITDENYEGFMTISVQVTVNSTGQTAQLYEGNDEDADAEYIEFEWNAVPILANMWLDHDEVSYAVSRPSLSVESQNIDIYFSWLCPNGGDIVELSVEKVVQMLENFIAFD